MPLNQAWQRCFIEIQLPVNKIFVSNMYQAVLSNKEALFIFTK